MVAKKKSARKSASSEKPIDDVSSKLYDWIAEGYDVDPLVQVVKTKDNKKINRMFNRYEKNIARMEKLKKRLATLEIDPKNPKLRELLNSFKNPELVDDVENFLTALETGPKIKELKGELASLNVTGFEEKAERIKEKLENPELIDEAARDVKALRRRIKEKFFEEAFEEVVVPTEDDEGKSVAETIFLLHKDGTLLAVKSKIPPAELDKRLLSRMVMAIRKQMSKAFKEGLHIHTLDYEGHSIILENSAHCYAAVVVNGEATPIMYKIILKALQIMEKKLKKEFDNWTGDRSTLKNLEKYTTAIFQAIDKVG
jgi:hypothetical protein